MLKRRSQEKKLKKKVERVKVIFQNTEVYRIQIKRFTSTKRTFSIGRTLGEGRKNETRVKEEKKNKGRKIKGVGQGNRRRGNKMNEEGKLQIFTIMLNSVPPKFMLKP